MAKLKITVDKPKCISSGDCVETAPTVFQLDTDGKSDLMNPTGASDAVIVVGGARMSGQGHHGGRRRHRHAVVPAAEKVVPRFRLRTRWLSDGAPRIG